jgi:hypothetical protein
VLIDALAPLRIHDAGNAAGVPVAA